MKKVPCQAYAWLRSTLLLLLSLSGAFGCDSGSAIFAGEGTPSGRLIVDPYVATIQVGTTQIYTATLITDTGEREDVTARVTWDSSDGSVATVAPTGLATSSKVGETTISARLGELVSEASLTVAQREITALTVYPPEDVTLVGVSRPLQAFAVFDDGSFQDVTAVAEWSSADEAIAAVETGAATGVSQGATTVTAQFQATSGTAAFVVLDAKVKSLVLDPPQASIAQGTESELTARLLLEDGQLIAVTEQCEWTSSDDAVQVSDSPGRRGHIRGVKAGEASVKATLNYAGSSVSAEAAIVVTDALARELVVLPPQASVPVGTVGRLEAIAYFSDGSFANVSNVAGYVSSDQDVLHVVPNGPNAGDGQALSAGEATVTVTFEGLSAKSVITVTEAQLTDFVVVPGNVSVPAGTFGRFQAEAHFDDGTVLDVSALASWVSSDEQVLQVVNSGGLAGHGLALAEGIATITAVFGDSSSSAEATVTAAQLRSLVITPQDQSVPTGVTRSYTATAVYSDGSVSDVTALASWTSSDLAVASISGTGPDAGLATTYAEGTTVISAQFGDESAESTLTVTAAVLESLLVTPRNTTTGLLIPVQHTAMGTYSDGSTVDLTSVVTWSTGDASIAYIDEMGVARGLRPGSTGVGASYEGLADGVVFQVVEPTVESFEIRPASLTLPLGGRGVLSAFAVVKNGDQVLELEVSDVTAWLSDDREVAWVVSSGAQKGLVAARGLGNTTVTASWRGQNATASIDVTAAEITAIQVTPPDETRAPGLIVNYQAVATYSDSTSRDVTDEVAWTSSEPVIASVTQSGLARALSFGVAEIEASLEGVTGGASLTVSDLNLEDYWIIPNTAEVPTETTGQFTAIAKYSDGDNNAYEFDATESSSWTVNYPDRMSIVGSGENAGYAEALQTGDVIVSSTMPDGSNNVLSKAYITITGPVLRSIEISPHAASIPVGHAQAFTATGVFADDSTADITSDVVWQSSDPLIAAAQNGANHFLGLKKGEVSITATFDGVVGTAALSVTDAVAEQVWITPAIADYAVGTVHQFKLEAVMSDGSAADLTEGAAWLSDAPGVLAVVAGGSIGGLNYARAEGTANVSASHPLVPVAPEPAAITVMGATLESLVVVPAVAELASGLSLQYSAVGLYSDNRQVDLTDSVVWSTSDVTVAWVDSEGLVTTASRGDVTVAASLDGIEDEAELTVTEAEVVGIRVDPAGIILPVGAVQAYSCTAELSNGRKTDVTALASWSSSKPEVAYLDPPAAPDFQVLATGASEGLTQIVGQISIDGRTFSDRVPLNVTASALDALVVSTTAPVITVDGVSQFEARAVYSDGNSVDVTDLATWSSEDPAVATISSLDDPGLATAHAVGDSAITATYEGLTDSETLVVYASSITSLSIDPVEATGVAGDTSHFRAYANHLDGRVEDVTEQATWSTSDFRVAIVYKGAALALASGTATIAAEIEGERAEATLTVGSVASALIVLPGSVSLPPGTSFGFAAEVTIDGEQAEVTDEVIWSSSNESVATIRNDDGFHGRVTAGDPGVSTITAQYTSVDGQELVATATVTVVDTGDKPVRVRVEPNGATLDVNQTRQYHLIGEWDIPGGGLLELDLTDQSQTTWKSTGDAASVSNVQETKGIVTGIEPGTALIEGSYRGVKGETNVTVNNL